jgi:hypothetical protein
VIPQITMPNKIPITGVSRCAPTIALLVMLLVACVPDDLTAPTLTPTHAITGPTIAPSPQPFLGPPTEGPPPQEGIGFSDPTAAAQPNQGALPPRALDAAGSAGQPIDLPALDGTLLTGTLYQTGTERQPGVLLLANSDWGDFPAQLSAAGFTVLVMGLREGGDETDVEAMIEALISGAADPAHIAVVGASDGADMALRGCAIIPACDTVVLLSPLDERTLLSVLPLYNPRPMMIVASEEDADSFDTAQALDAAATGDNLFQPFVEAGHGTAILSNRPDLGQLIIAWLQQWLVTIPS